MTSTLALPAEVVLSRATLMFDRFRVAHQRHTTPLHPSSDLHDWVSNCCPHLRDHILKHFADRPHLSNGGSHGVYLHANAPERRLCLRCSTRELREGREQCQCGICGLPANPDNPRPRWSIHAHNVFDVRDYMLPLTLVIPLCESCHEILTAAIDPKSATGLPATAQLRYDIEATFATTSFFSHRDRQGNTPHLDLDTDDPYSHLHSDHAEPTSTTLEDLRPAQRIRQKVFGNPHGGPTSARFM